MSRVYIRNYRVILNEKKDERIVRRADFHKLKEAKQVYINLIEDIQKAIDDGFDDLKEYDEYIDAIIARTKYDTYIEDIKNKIERKKSKEKQEKIEEQDNNHKEEQEDQKWNIFEKDTTYPIYYNYETKRIYTQINKFGDRFGFIASDYKKKPDGSYDEVPYICTYITKDKKGETIIYNDRKTYENFIEFVKTECTDCF